ncbi:hypothetical protein ACWIUD_05560 [Helicobacter sp. 23-1044]
MRSTDPHLQIHKKQNGLPRFCFAESRNDRLFFILPTPLIPLRKGGENKKQILQIAESRFCEYCEYFAILCVKFKILLIKVKNFALILSLH